MGRTPCCEKVGLRKGRWTAEEDDILTKYIQANGEGSWRSLPKNAGLLRCGKSCRLRWINYLRADLKRGNISAEEEDLIVKLHASFGNRWSLIASHMPGRTDNEIKNYWNSHLSRKIYSFRRPASTDMDHTPKVDIPRKRKDGRISRWAMKKNKSYSRKDTQMPKQSVTQQNNNNNEAIHQKQNNNEAAVQLPPIPAPESEALTSAILDFMVLDPDVEDMVERVELVDEPSSYQEIHEGNGPDSLLSCDRDIEVPCPVEAVKTTHEKSMLCVEGEKQITDDILGPYQEEEGINGGGGTLSFSDIMDSCVLEACGVSTLSEERESNDVVGVGEENACPNRMAASEDRESSVNLSPNGESGEWYSCSSMPLDLDDIWDWERESTLEMNDHNNIKSEAREHKENLLTWLWQDDDNWESDCKKLGEIDMVAWFLS